MPAGARPSLRTWTVRSRIVGLLTLLSLVTVFVAGGVAYVVERSRVLEQIDRNLEAALDAGGFTVAQQEWESADQALQAIVQRLAPDDNTGTLGIVDGSAAWKPGVQTDVQLEALPGFVERIVAETAGGEIVMGTYAQDGRTVRYLSAPVIIGEPAAGEPPSAVFVTGYDVAAELAELDEAARVFSLTALLATAATFVIGLLVSGRLLRPIRRMREVAERSSEASLTERIPVGDSRDDVSQLAVTVNGMLDRLGGALDSQRDLLRDVGHELKTPITIVRGHLELVDEHDPAEVAETRALVIDELDRMARLVDDLRAAARLRDADAFAIRETDLAALTEQIAMKARGVEGAALEERVEAAPVLARLDPGRITQAMLQLVANAARHAQGPIAIGSRQRGRDVELFVRDRGPGVPDELKAVIFERFRRGVAEGRGDDGSGLGLAIVALIAERHGGRAWVADAGAGSEFVLTLPGTDVAPPAQGAAAAPVAPPPVAPHPARPGAAAHPTPAAPTGAARPGAPSHPPADPAAAAAAPEEQPWHRS
ncbi:HAMP domain-containing sensor histidine kinase [Agrococcus sp. SCSIO52902]|uniref:sensor histidine kinase n=1 Tax=Agrococcus sp. SCSIO52902 TaxID=2933290 RepID=UPI001FF2E2D3|nr:HAMP domain-containing sensor histidine kinase [Agrococcus sp. SCSIO52902]UOW01925.1 HAMP domain-containing histidine kinase [Agrococcus sp. SCSIO52902]